MVLIMFNRLQILYKKAQEGKKVCTVWFLDEVQDFDRIHHETLIGQSSKLFPKEFVDVLTLRPPYLLY